jgi:Zn-dependent peptidase ImmA (M78 family)
MFRRGFKSSSEEASLKIRRKLVLASTAPVDPASIAELLAIPILKPQELSDLPQDVCSRLQQDHSDAWSAITVSDGKSNLIVLNPTHAQTRLNSSLAHEIAHVILGHEPSVMFLMSQPETVPSQQEVILRTHNREQEDEANWLAGCILLPRDALLHIRRLGLSDDRACSEYRVSPAMLRFRINATGVDVQGQRAQYRGPSPRSK